MKFNAFGHSTKERIEQLEQQYNLRLPVLYRQFLLSMNGGTIDPSSNVSLLVPKLGENIELETLYGLDQSERCFDIDAWMREYGQELPPHALLIGDDRLKGFLILICEGEQSGIYYWDDAHNFEQSNDRNNAYLISSDFTYLDAILPSTASSTILPLGSVVLLEGATKKLLVIARAINVRNGGKNYFFDYGGVPYPEGLTGDQMAYFNADNISRVVFEGYRDIDDDNLTDSIRGIIVNNPELLRGNAETWDAKTQP